MGLLDFFKRPAVGSNPHVLELQDEAVLAKNTIAELDTKLNTAAAQLEKTKELAELQLASAAKQEDVEQENRLLLTQLIEVQEELEMCYLDKVKFEKLCQEMQVQINALNKESIDLKNINEFQKTEIVKVKAELESAQRQNTQNKVEQDNAEQEKGLLLTRLIELQKESEVYYLDKVKYEKIYQEMQVQIDALNKESVDLKNTIKSQKSEIVRVQLELESAVRQNSPNIAKQDNAEQELLLTQLMEVQEELEVHYLDKVKFEKLYQEMKVRWARLEKRHPNYVDFGSIELVSFDNLLDSPSVTWRIKDYVQGGIVLDEFVFHTILRDGQPGISIGFDAQKPSSLDSALVPKLIKPQSKELERFAHISQSDFGQIMAAAGIIAQLEASSWRGVQLPEDFDLGFWRQSLKLLPTQLQALPVLLRYDAVKLKRELINPDYEHLWLEIKGMGLGSRIWPKFEIRLGAAMVQHSGFSQFPKFEIPLIDGKSKPFDSWYAESQDDNGAKLELRFSLEKQVFDANVWSRLDGADRALFLRLIYSMPDILLRLQADHVAIHRPWASWVDLAKSAMQVIEVNRMAAKPKDLPVLESKPAGIVTAAVTPVQLPSPNARQVNLEKTAPKKTSSTKQGSKLTSKLSITAKKNAATIANKLDKKTSDTKQPLLIKQAVRSKKVENTKLLAKKVVKKNK